MTGIKSNNFLNHDQIVEFQQLLLGWFKKNQRHFPWRETSNPFQILIAEKLLQQTSAGDRVVSAYLSIITKYPDPKSLANASLEDLKKIVSTLGLHYRAKELINLALAIEINYSGTLPNNYKALLELPGVGEYSARAILSFGFNEDIAIVDTNVARILFRVFGIENSMPANPARKKYLIDLATLLIPKEKSRDFNFAILDFSAIICKLLTPICNSCPVNRYCFYFRKTYLHN